MSPFSYGGPPRAKSRLIVALAIVLWTAPAVAQDYRGSVGQRAACTPDAFRLCASYIPDATKVEMCLRSKTPDLSPACRSVFSQSSASVVGANQ
jgi:hypothetical protein